MVEVLDSLSMPLEAWTPEGTAEPTAELGVPNLYLRHGGPRVWTERRSVQGLWQPSAEGMFRVSQLQKVW